MSNIIPFDSGNLPAYLRGAEAAGINDDLTAHASSGFPVLSIKGKTFSVSRGGERTVLMNPKDPDSVASSLELVILKANKGTSKVFYIKGYVEGGEATKPDCFSNEGTKPDASVEKPQSKSCAVCPKAQWGSKISDDGRKGKACQDSVRIAVAAADAINDPMLLRVPPASIKALGEFGDLLKKRGGGKLAYNMVVTRVGFVTEEASPKLTFKPVGMLSDEAYALVKDTVQSDTVQSILGNGYAFESAELEVEPTPVPDIPKAPPVVEKPAAKAKPKAEPKPEPKPAPAAVDMEVEGLSLDDLNFDD
jgi:hypothetical protein